MHRRLQLCVLALAALVTASGADANRREVPCENAPLGQGFRVGDAHWLSDGFVEASGWHPTREQAALTVIMACASGQQLRIYDAGDAQHERLRDWILSPRPVTLSQMAQALQADGVRVALRGTTEDTCLCDHYARVLNTEPSNGSTE